MSALPTSIYFLGVDEVKVIHADQIAHYGGSLGIRDEGLLSSAVAQPCAMFGDQYLHPTLPDMAAAYLFHLVMNHPFVDGNKRAGLATALVFLEMNGMELDSALDELQPDGKTRLEQFVIDLTAGKATKDDLRAIFSRHVHALTTK